MAPSRRKKKILIIDDDLSFVRKVSDSLDLLGFETMVTNNPLIALESIRSFDFNLIIANYHLRDKTGPELMEEIKKVNAETPVIMVSSDPNIEIREESMALGASNFFLKQQEFERMLLVIYKGNIRSEEV